MVNGFQIWSVVLAYTIAVIAVGFHLRHGTWSALTTLGANTSSLARRRLNVARVRGGRGAHGWLPASSLRHSVRVRELMGDCDSELEVPVTNSELLDSLDADSFYIEGADIADTKAPEGPIERRWEERRFEARLVNPANRRKLT